MQETSWSRVESRAKYAYPSPNLGAHNPNASLFRQNSASTGHVTTLLIPCECDATDGDLTEKQELFSKRPY